MLTSLVGSDKILEQEQCITKKEKKKENKKLLLEIKSLIAAIKNSAEKLEDKLRKSFRIWSKDLKRFFK